MFFQKGNAQTTEKALFEEAFVHGYPIEISWDKTTLLVFPTAVESADRGTKHILAQKDKKASNILKLKAGMREFTASNLNVITADGQLYHFKVSYCEDPSELTIDMGKQLAREKEMALFKDLSLNPDQVNAYAQKIAPLKPFLRKKERDYHMKLHLQGVYIVEDILFFQFGLSNTSRIDYRIDQLRYTVKDRKLAKRTAERQEEKMPLLNWFESGEGVSGQHSNTLVVAFEQFTIADKKEFVVQILEKSGDRHLTLRIKGKDILKARPWLNTNIKR
ncbi:hypothetical protein AWW67_13260 [Roseivirga seohaensis]|jgi:conjugative transposon TraN protein|uniref:Conjugative transposon protein TraN n=2 Tax=Roseivirga seohaensis TaxID=1914963 RepID=A0A150XKS3_9BACT|nr:hypothetical protein AWW67_13260 [Roseivirga seohaensis]|tara:strand:+ start:344 stop:1171 length:828 start_codon:yes stop_codon:yes gene_type:complete